MKTLIHYLFILILMTSSAVGAKAQDIAMQSNIDLVQRFFSTVQTYQLMFPVNGDSLTNTMAKSLKNSLRSDSAFLNAITNQYILADSSISHKERDKDGYYIRIRKELNLLKYFLHKYPPEQFTIRPLSIGKESPFNDLISYQQKNTLIVLYKNKPVMYLLIVPQGTIKNMGSRILSWQLVYTMGQYEFQDVLGNRGIEYFL